MGRQKGNLTEEKVLKALLNAIDETISQNKKSYKKWIGKITSTIKKLELKNYDFSDNVNVFDIPIPVISDNYDKLPKFVMELPQKIVDSSNDITGFIIVIDEFQLLKNVEDPEADETKRYIDEKSNNLKFTNEGFERFYNCTRGIPLYINSLSSILPNNTVCDEDIIKETLLLNIDQVAIMWIYIWGRLSQGEKDFIIYLLEHEGATRATLDKQLGYSKSSVTRFIDSLSNQGIIEFSQNKKFVLADKMLQFWLKIKFETGGCYPL